MNVGIVTTWFERGAAYVSWLYRQTLTAEGAHVFIFARGGEEEHSAGSRWDVPDVWRASNTLARNTTFRRREFATWIRKNDIDVVLFNEQQWLPPVLWARDMGVKTVAYVDYYTEDSLPTFRAYDLLLCNTRRHFSAFDWHPGAVFVPWGTNINLYHPSGTWPAVDNPVRIVHSAGYNPRRKGTDLLVRAMEHVQAEVHVTIQSQVPLERFFPSLRPLLSSLQERRLLTLVPREVTAPGIYGIGDVYVYPSRLDGIGLTQVEAIASGLALVTPDWPPMNEFMDARYGVSVAVEKIWARADGYYWPQTEVAPRALAAAIDMIAGDPSRLRNMKRAARDAAETSFDWTRNSSGLTKLLADAPRQPDPPETSVWSKHGRREAALMAARHIYRMLSGRSSSPAR